MRPGDIEALALTGDREILKDDEVLVRGDGRAVDGREDIDRVLDRHLASGPEHPTDLDRGVIVTHERDGWCRRGVFVGRWTE